MAARETVVNVEQARAWDGAEGDNWTDNEDWYNAAARYLTPPLFALAAIAPAEHVLDIGCGTGATTVLAARQARAGAAFGIDLSTRMIERARRHAEAGREVPNPPRGVPLPFAFSEADRVRMILGAAGLARVTFDPLEQPMYFGPDPQGAFLGVTKLSIARSLLADLDGKRRQEALSRLRVIVERHQTPAGVLFDTSAWLVRATKAQEGEES